MAFVIFNLLCVAALVGLDQAIKFWAVSALQPVGAMPLIPHVVELRIVLNQGMAFSLLSLVLGGGIGNLIDRVLNGEVVDYINLLFMRFAVFNFADICVCVGVALWVLVIFLEELHEDTKKDPKEQ